MIRGVDRGGPAEREAERLAALERYAIVGTAREDAYDDIVRRVAAICAVPCATVVFVDAHRVWYKAAVGVDQTESPREGSFAEHVLGSGEPVFEVRDLRRDLRFATQHYVVGMPFFRFYAGAPIVTADGFVIGIVGALDVVPGALTSEQRSAMVLAARHVMSLLEVRELQSNLSATQSTAAATELALQARVDEDRRSQSRLRSVPRLVTEAGAAQPADLPALLESALAYVRDHRAVDAGLLVGFVEVDRIDHIAELLGASISLDIVHEVVSRIRNVVRESDWVMPVARNGVLLLMEGDARAIPESLEPRLTASFASGVRFGAHETPITVNAALVRIDENYETAAEIVRDVNLSLDAARALPGRARVVSGDAQRQRFDLMMDLCATVFGPTELREFSVVFQPIAALHAKQRRVIAVEASVRWDHPQRGIVAADALLEAGVGTGVNAVLGQFTLAEACKQMRTWQLDTHTTRRQWSMFVPVSDEVWHDPSFLARFYRSVEESGTALRDISLTVAAASVARDVERSVDVMRDLDARGASIVLDGFGRGDILLADLHRLPVSCVKVDPSFVRAADGADLADPAAIATLVGLAHRFDIGVIACGVTTESQREMLAELECEAFQGPLLAPPLPAGLVNGFLARRRGVSGAPSARTER